MGVAESGYEGSRMPLGSIYLSPVINGLDCWIASVNIKRDTPAGKQHNIPNFALTRLFRNTLKLTHRKYVLVGGLDDMQLN